jgi:hypothetical protein
MHRIKYLALTLLLFPAMADAQNVKSSNAEKVRNALLAAPQAIAADAAVLDWPASPGEKPAVLRPGTNGWSCLPDLPATQGPDPMCIDDQWLKFIDAYGKKEAPRIDRVGFGYMMSGHAYGSNTDPFAVRQTADNQWGMDPPHIMIVVPDARVLDGLPTTRSTTKPWVMFKGTPYAHIMVPVEPRK